MSNEKDNNQFEDMLNSQENNNENLTENLEVTEDTTAEVETETNTTATTSDNKNIKSEKKENKLVKLFKSRKLRKGGLSVAFTAVFIVAVIIINMIASLITAKVPALTFDLSTSQASILSQDTIDFITTIDKDVTITVLAAESTYTKSSNYYLMANTLLKQYANTNSKVKIEYVDLTANPTYLNNYPNDTLLGGNYIVKCGDKYRILTMDDLFETQLTSDYSSREVVGLNVEPAVTTAILNVTSENQIKLQFIDGFGNYDASAFQNLLKQNNYDISNVSTLTGEIDKNAEAIILYTPTVDLDDASLEKIKTYLSNNGEYGKNLIYVAPPQATDTPNLDALLEEWGMKMGEGLVAETDTSKLIYNSYLYSVLDYSNTDYTDGLKDNTLSLVGGYIVPVEITNSNTATPLLVTSTMAKLFPFTADEKFDIESADSQQYNAAAVGTKTSGDDMTSNVVAIGSYLIPDGNALAMSSYNNGAYLINMVNKLTNNTDEGITIDGKDLTNPSLGITTDQINLLTAICMVVLPIIIMVIGIVIWVRRRNR